MDAEELDRIGQADELHLASGAGRELRRYVTMWVVRVGDSLYVRSADGPATMVSAREAAGAGRVRAAVLTAT